jgi:RecB family exonuclease
MVFDGIDRFIAEKISEAKGARFVFPSQVAADFRLRRALSCGSLRAIRKERFCSWDTFKERCFDEARKERPVNGALRMLFAAALLEENSVSRPPLLKRLVPAEFADLSRSYRSLLVGMLPKLEGFSKELEANNARGFFPPPFLEDMDFLADRYRNFLSERGLFEPGSSIPEPEPLPGHSFIFFPEVIEDYGEYASVLSRSSWVTVLSTEQLIREDETSRPSLLRFPGAGAELARLMDDITRLLREGEDPGEIAITLPDREEWRERLAAAAANRSIKLRFRGGDPLSESVPGRFLRALWETVSGDWELEQTGRLLLDRGVPWRADGVLRRIVRFGRDYYCHRGARRWEERLRKADRPVLASRFVKLQEGVRLLTEAGSFALLKERIQPFLQTHLDSDAWSDADMPVLQRCLESLGDLVEAEAAAGNGEVGPVFPLWLSYLETKQYVRRQEKCGIAVYNYRVSAGISPRHHFLPGCGQDKSRVLIRRFPFLSEAQKKQLGGSEQDLSAPFIHLYAFAGSGAKFSFSDEGFGGPDLPPSELIDCELSPGPAASADPYRGETLYWRGGEAPEWLWPEQKLGAGRFLATGGAGKRVSFTRSPVSSPAVLDRLLSSLRGNKEQLEISPSLLEAFWSCPFAFLADRCLKAREPELNIRYNDPRLTGNLFHKAAAHFFYGLGEEAPFASRSPEEFKELMKITVASLFRQWRAGGDPVPLPPVADSIERFVSASASAMAEAHLAVYGNYRSAGIEKRLETGGRGLPVQLAGRMDWIGRNDSGYLVVDYKKNLRLKKGDLLPPDEDHYPSSFQIAFYRYLCREKGYGNVSAAYFDMTKERYTTVCGDGEKPWFSEETADKLNDTLEEALGDMVRRLDEGDFRIDDSACGGCGIRGACRERFHIRDEQWK